MIGISYNVQARIHRLWRVAVVFVLLNISTNIFETANGDNTTRPETTLVSTAPLTTTKSIVVNVTTESSLIPHVNVTAVTGNYVDHGASEY